MSTSQTAIHSFVDSLRKALVKEKGKLRHLRIYSTPTLINDQAFDSTKILQMARLLKGAAKDRPAGADIEVHFISTHLAQCLTPQCISNFNGIATEYWGSELKKRARSAESNVAMAKQVTDGYENTVASNQPSGSKEPDFGTQLGKLLTHFSHAAVRATQFSDQKITQAVQEDWAHFIQIAAKTFQQFAPLWTLEASWNTLLEPAEQHSRPKRPLQGYQMVVLSAKKAGRSIDEILRVYRHFLQKKGIRRKPISPKVMSVYVSRWKTRARDLGVYNSIDENMHSKYLRR